jgi:hypothetical protein
MAEDLQLPTFDELPSFEGMKGCAWQVWTNPEAGFDVELGTVNLLTPNVVQKAAQEEIR